MEGDHPTLDSRLLLEHGCKDCLCSRDFLFRTACGFCDRICANLTATLTLLNDTQTKQFMCVVIATSDTLTNVTKAAESL